MARFDMRMPWSLSHRASSRHAAGSSVPPNHREPSTGCDVLGPMVIIMWMVHGAFRRSPRTQLSSTRKCWYNETRISGNSSSRLLLLQGLVDWINLTSWVSVTYDRNGQKSKIELGRIHHSLAMLGQPYPNLTRATKLHQAVPRYDVGIELLLQWDADSLLLMTGLFTAVLTFDKSTSGASLAAGKLYGGHYLPECEEKSKYAESPAGYERSSSTLSQPTLQSVNTNSTILFSLIFVSSWAILQNSEAV
ncbi:hypothetical protein Q9966_011254 [Columba livia]|nr:hypothetical protein Q9966_011254 [Columba livia]